MLPELKPNDIVIITPISNYECLNDGDFVLISDDKQGAMLQQFVVGENYSDIYLVSTSDEFKSSPHKKALDYKLLGKVHSKYRQYSSH